MPNSKHLVFVCAALMPFIGAGCVHAARDTTGFAVTAETTVEASFEEAWQGVKAALREEGLEIYTRDKRGEFTAYTTMRRRYLQPKRVAYTLLLTERAEGGTHIVLSAVRERYGVTPLTYPDWHERKTESIPELDALIASIEAHCEAGQPAPAP